MEFTIYRDLASIAFIRCTSPIPGTRFCAEGTDFSVSSAIEKCRSERIERLFQLTHPARALMLGIAAHPDAAASEENAWNEAIETLLLKRLAEHPVFFGISIALLGTRVCVGRINDRFIALALFSHSGVPTATQAVARNPLKAVLKTWAEVRNLRLYSPTVGELPIYTKANKILSGDQLSKISVRMSRQRNMVETGSLKKLFSKEQTHFVTYFTQETKE
jgi:hypothetical protein